MKNFILGFVVALILAGAAYAAFPWIKGFFGGASPVSPEMLKPGVLDYGTLKVKVLGKGAPLPDVEVDLGTIGINGPEGLMTFARTDDKGEALFERVPVGTYNIFWNAYFFPKEYEQPSRMSVAVEKSGIVEKTIDLQLKK